MHNMHLSSAVAAAAVVAGARCWLACSGGNGSDPERRFPHPLRSFPHLLLALANSSSRRLEARRQRHHWYILDVHHIAVDRRLLLVFESNEARTTVGDACEPARGHQKMVSHAPCCVPALPPSCVRGECPCYHQAHCITPHFFDLWIARSAAPQVLLCGGRAKPALQALCVSGSRHRCSFTQQFSTARPLPSTQLAWHTTCRVKELERASLQWRPTLQATLTGPTATVAAPARRVVCPPSPPAYGRSWRRRRAS